MRGHDHGKALVAGGAGFLGSHLCERLISEGFDVLCIDNLSTGSESNLAHLRESGRFDFLYHDVTESFSAEADFMFNLACPASPTQYKDRPLETLRASFIGVMNLLELARATGAPLFHASTSEIYGDPGVHPQPESYNGNVNPVGERACYNEGKRCAETLFITYQRQYRIEGIIGRLFNTYGPRMAPDDGRVVSNFIVQALRNRPLTIHGSGEQTRSFCYVEDLIDGIFAVFDNQAELLGPVNLGNPEEVTIRELAELIIELTNSRSPMVEVPRSADDPSRRRPDISLATSLTAWHPSTSLRDGLRATILWFDELLRQQ